MDNKNILSVEAYAKLCGVSKTVIYNRITEKEIKPMRIFVSGYPTLVIDIVLFPPQPSKPRGRKKLTYNSL